MLFENSVMPWLVLWLSDMTTVPTRAFSFCFFHHASGLRRGGKGLAVAAETGVTNWDQPPVLPGSNGIETCNETVFWEEEHKRPVTLETHENSTAAFG
jgi:hypothetical protein